MSIAVFFTLACWGTSDITKLNFYFDPARASGPSLQELLPSEPVWWLLAPWIIHLPYRMAAVHGLLVAAYARSPFFWPALGDSRLGPVGGLCFWSAVRCFAAFFKMPIPSGVGVVTRGSSAALVLARDSLEAWSDPWSSWIGAGNACISSANVAFGLDACLPDIISGLRQHKRLVLLWDCLLLAWFSCCGRIDCKTPGLCRLWFFQYLSD